MDRHTGIFLTILLVASLATNVVFYWSAKKIPEVLFEITMSGVVINTAQAVARDINALHALDKGNLDEARAQLEKNIDLQMMGLQADAEGSTSVADLARNRLKELGDRLDSE